MKRILRDYSYLALISGTIILLDQISKNWIRANLPMGQVWIPWEGLPFARIVHWYNTGVAFGMFQGGNQFFSILSIGVALIIIYFYSQVPAKDWPLRLAMAFQLGGAVGNLIDRLTIGHVTDFVQVGNFPVFNVADSSITLGVGVLLIGVWLQERKEKGLQKLELVPGPDPSSNSEVASRE